MGNVIIVYDIKIFQMVKHLATYLQLIHYILKKTVFPVFVAPKQGTFGVQKL